ncbi:RRQRL motif-containing zinc-binding protein [Pseudonocardia sp. GCM10023141]|uniref:RRQRL motif-containing zinc-binding protein n=1 Tax=Pseudonocardia sp. GCM10023141 TaxID=3252653 RepID=UPI003608BD33
MSGPRAARGTSTTLWDGREWPCAGRYARVPVFRYGWAPSGLATVRQLAGQDLRPAGQDVAGWLVWKTRPSRRGWAYLYRVDLARPKRIPSAAQLASIARCNVVQQWCPTCRTDVGYRIPRSLGECVDCAETAIERDLARHTNQHLNAPAGAAQQHSNERVGHPVGVVIEHVEFRESA